MISFVVHARNSGGHMRLMIDKLEGGEYGMVLVGDLEGQRIQIDFDNLSEAEIQDLANFIAYRRGDLLDKRRELMLAWEKYLGDSPAAVP